MGVAAALARAFTTGAAQVGALHDRLERGIASACRRS
jgi:hypothetical protein